MSSRVFITATQIMVMAIVISVVLLFMGIGVLVLIHLCIVGRAFRRGFNTGNTTGERDRDRDIDIAISHEDIQRLPCFEFKAAEKDSSSPSDCAVCLDNFQIGEKCRLLPICKHSFHAQCVDSWLLKTPLCPICRTTADPRKGSDSSSHFREIQPVVVGILVSSNSLPLNDSTPSP